MASLQERLIDGAIVRADLAAALERAATDSLAAAERGELGTRPSAEHVLLREAGPYAAYAIDLEILWRWEIYLGEDRLVQDGVSISLASAREAVGHVLAYFSLRDSETNGGETPAP
jgi:soluble methane monooxygenase-binding protein MmoD